MCAAVCPKNAINISLDADGFYRPIVLYGASAKNPDVVKNTTSGGIADLMAHKLIKDGYKCVGVVYDSDRDAAIDTIAETEDELLGFRGSKYIQSYTVEAFKQIVKMSNICS